MVGRMLICPLKLSVFDIRYKIRKALKAQVLADFVAKMMTSDHQATVDDIWTIFVYKASSSSWIGEGIILENGESLVIEVSLILSFPTSNN